MPKLPNEIFLQQGFLKIANLTYLLRVLKCQLATLPMHRMITGRNKPCEVTDLLAHFVIQLIFCLSFPNTVTSRINDEKVAIFRQTAA